MNRQATYRLSRLFTIADWARRQPLFRLSHANFAVASWNAIIRARGGPPTLEARREAGQASG